MKAHGLFIYIMILNSDILYMYAKKFVKQNDIKSSVLYWP